MAVKVSLKDLIESGAHFGHQSRRWNPKMGKYLYGEQDGNHIFDLIKTKKSLEEALLVITEHIKKNKKVLLVGTKKQARDKVEQIGRDTGIFYVYERWLGGTLTNFEQIKKSIRKLKDLKEKTAAGEFKDYTKKERLLIEREIERLERFFGGIAEMDKLPELLIIVDTKKEQTVVREAEAMGIETVGIVDSNADPDDVTYPIPMNDDATRAVEYVLDLIKDAILAGSKKK